MGKRLDLVEFDESQIVEFLIELKSEIDETYFRALSQKSLIQNFNRISAPKYPF